MTYETRKQCRPYQLSWSDKNKVVYSWKCTSMVIRTTLMRVIVRTSLGPLYNVKIKDPFLFIDTISTDTGLIRGSLSIKSIR